MEEFKKEIIYFGSFSKDEYKKKARLIYNELNKLSDEQIMELENVDIVIENFYNSISYFGPCRCKDGNSCRFHKFLNKQLTLKGRLKDIKKKIEQKATDEFISVVEKNIRDISLNIF
ncbi:MAG: hypothetical protein JHC31_04960 [Sulfurihydrogenibium sp.]|jgi:hypothetical protein|nr:hypothetical protein [Sulfurihydrogenibium sp.]